MIRKDFLKAVPLCFAIYFSLLRNKKLCWKMRSKTSEAVQLKAQETRKEKKQKKRINLNLYDFWNLFTFKISNLYNCGKKSERNFFWLGISLNFSWVNANNIPPRRSIKLNFLFSWWNALWEMFFSFSFPSSLECTLCFYRKCSWKF